MEFVYDALGRRVETIDYVDAATGATLTTPKLTRHVYLGLETIQEYECGPDGYACDTGYVKSREFVWGDPDRFPEVAAMVRYMQEYHPVPPGEPPIPPTPYVDGVFHYLHDALGSVIGLVDAAGELVERYTYDPYGKVFIEKWDEDANEGAGDWVASSEPTSGLPHSAVGNPFLWTGQRYDESTATYGFHARSYSPTLGRFLQRDPLEYDAGSVNLYEYVLSAPLFWTDPLGLIKRDKGGKIIIKRSNRIIPVRRGNVTGKLRVVQIEADDGTKITALEQTEGDPGWKTNCHGQTFCDGELWVEPDQVDKILKGDKYEKKTGVPCKGDVIIYRNKRTGTADHSATVSKVDKTGDIIVSQEGGIEVGLTEKKIGPGPGTAWVDTNLLR